MPHCNLIIIGSSTGGPKILEHLIPHLPILNAAVLIVQHITPTIDRALATSLAKISKMPVNLATSGDTLRQGEITLAAGGMHLTLIRNRTIKLFCGEKVNSVCPSIDVTMKSVIAGQGGDIVGVILSGMGRDGAEGLCHIKDIGGLTIAQDQSTSIIFGMPRAAIDTGKVDHVLATEDIGKKLRDLFSC